MSEPEARPIPTQADALWTPEVCGVWADILSQAVTGELIGMQNYASMSGLFEAEKDQADAVDHASSELRHARTFRRAAHDLGLVIVEDTRAPYWRRIREAFLRQVEAKDMVACLVIQEIMLESFAVSMYQSVAEVAEGTLARTFAAIADEERGHFEHAVEELGPEFARDRDGFIRKVGELHDAVMVPLAEMVAPLDRAGHCGLCYGACVKQSLRHVGLSAAELRGRALNAYVQGLDRLGIPTDVSLRWVCNLPA
jgi:fatty aldehyde decarbonylase